MRSADFERALAARATRRTEHFALHHAAAAAANELSTAHVPAADASVDDCRCSAGVVIPKRHARRAVTRSLIKRQARQALSRHRASLQSGLWVVRLRAPFDPLAFPSAASAGLRDTVRRELDRLFASST